MITKQLTVRGDEVMVTFSLPASDRRVSVVGDFNDWSRTANPLAHDGDTDSASVILNAGRRYAFRYVDQDGRWFDDNDADAFEASPLGGTNGIIDLTALLVDEVEPETTAPAAGSAAGWLWPIEKAVELATEPVARVTRLLRRCR